MPKPVTNLIAQQIISILSNRLKIRIVDQSSASEFLRAAGEDIAADMIDLLPQQKWNIISTEVGKLQMTEGIMNRAQKLIQMCEAGAEAIDDAEVKVLLKQIRKLIGVGKTTKERGMIYLDFEHSSDAWETTLAALKKAFGEYSKEGEKYIFTDSDSGRKIYLNSFLASTKNQFVAFSYMPKGF